ncbi:MAG: MATE family efflux transporter [Treponema sp.]|nr:MATE family efflux transporter [Treponema sp.]
MAKLAIPEEQMLFPRKALVTLIVPLVAEQFLAITIGACDTLMVASIGEAGVSGVSLIDQLSQLMIQLFAAFATGGAVVSSQYLGRRDTKNACKAAKQLLTLSVVVALVIVVLSELFRAQILSLLYGKIDADVMENSLTYFFWVALSFPFLAVYNSAAAVFRSMGNSKLSLKVSILMNFTNIAGNAFLIYGLKIGVAGAGIATLASRSVAAIVMFVLLTDHRKNVVYLERPLHFEWNGAMTRRILKIGIPSGIENSVFQFGKLLVQTFMAGFGTAAIAANAICNSIGSLANVPGSALGLASVTVVGQCIGAGERKQAVHYSKVILREACISMGVLSVVIFIFTPQIVSLFNLSPEAAQLAGGVIRTCMVANIVLWPLSFTLPNTLRAAGDAKFTMIISNISMWSFRVLFSYLISGWLLRRFPETPSLALYGVWFGMYIDWLFRAASFVLRFKSGRWLEKKVI